MAAMAEMTVRADMAAVAEMIKIRHAMVASRKPLPPHPVTTIDRHLSLLRIGVKKC